MSFKPSPSISPRITVSPTNATEASSADIVRKERKMNGSLELSKLQIMSPDCVAAGPNPKSPILVIKNDLPRVKLLTRCPKSFLTGVVADKSVSLGPRECSNLIHSS